MRLIVKNLKKSFGNKEVLNNLSFHVAPGEIVCIKGKSGQGKTTLLRCLVNLEKVDGGSLQINNNFLFKEENGIVTYASEETLRYLRTQMSLVFQGFHLFPHMSVMDNLIEASIFLQQKKHSFNKDRKEQILQHANELLLQMDLGDYGHYFPHQLSGGQRQRIAIARACMLEPTVLCFDEPSSALDKYSRRQIGSIIKQLANNGISIILVTHDEALVEQMGCRVLTLQDGQLYNS